ncbi:MAG: fibronectin type III domain-containing protein [Solirubrobacterales bacterium]
MFKKLDVILLGAVMTVGVCIFSSSYVAATGNSGTNQNNKDWKTSINSSGNKGWFKHNTKWYYFNDKGEMDKGWLLHNGKWYFFNTGGDMQTGWLLHNGKWYFMSDEGDMKTGWVKNNNKWYYLNKGGDMSEGCWIFYNSKWYYLGNNGEMLVSTTTPDGYEVGADGAWTGKSYKITAPTVVSSTEVSSSEIQLQWEKITNADYYHVYYSLYPDKNFNPILSSDGSKKVFQWSSAYSASLKGIAPETKVYFKVTAVKDNSESNYSTVVNSTTKSGIIAAPTGLTAKTISTSSIELNWNELIGADYYYVYYRTSTEGAYTSVKKTGTSFNLTGLDPDTKVYFKIKSYKDEHVSAFSSEVNAATESDDSIAAPTGVKAQALSTSQIKVTWNKTAHADYYYVFHRESNDSTYTKVKVTTNSYTLTGLDSGTKVYFKIEAVKDGIVSPYSSTVYSTTN